MFHRTCQDFLFFYFSFLCIHISEYKEKKQKGEIIDTYYKVTLTKAFTDKKEPEFRTEISYANDIESAF